MLLRRPVRFYGTKSWFDMRAWAGLDYGPGGWKLWFGALNRSFAINYTAYKPKTAHDGQQ